MRFSPKLFVGIVAVLSLHTVSAQTDAPRPPVFDLLTITPDTPNARDTWSYIDYHALITSREGAVVPESFSEWFAGDSADDASMRAVSGALFSVSAGPSNFQTFMVAGEGYAEAIGIDFFEVERAVEYGFVPSIVTVLQGDFDPDTIDAAYSARGYDATSLLGLTTYCGENGCEGGMVQDISARNPADPFGGNLGLQRPVMVFDPIEANPSRDTVASATLFDDLIALEGAYRGDTPSLLDAPEYRAAAEAITQTGTLRQAYFLNPDELNLSSQVPTSLSPEAQNGAIGSILSEFDAIPDAQLFVIADSATETGQIAYAALVYEDTADAQLAIDTATERLESINSFVTSQTWADLLEDRSITLSSSVYESMETGLSVALIQMDTPPPAAFVEGEMPENSALAFRLLVNAWSQRDLLWLATGDGE